MQRYIFGIYMLIAISDYGIIKSRLIDETKGGSGMVYEKPVVIAQSVVRMAECRPNSKPSGRPCNKPGPSGR